MGPTPTIDRRAFLSSTAGLAVMSQIATTNGAAASGTAPTANGKPGDFNFLTGEWRIHNRFLENGRWIEFPGEATVRAILKGVCSIEELRIPARDFSGMGLRVLDMEKRLWSDHWVNAKSGVVTAPGQIGSFVDGVGTFMSEGDEGDRKMLYRGVWDRITPISCRWSQGASADGGKSWAESWFMDWTRVSG